MPLVACEYSVDQQTTRLVAELETWAVDSWVEAERSRPVGEPSGANPWTRR
jgi:hypothetical protein